MTPLESFRDCITKFRNQHVIVGMAPLFLLRQELTNSDDFESRQGFDDSAQHHFLTHLLNCDNVRRRVTYNPEDNDLGTEIAMAIDPDGVIETGRKPFGGDNIQNQSNSLVDFPWALDGTDADIPLRSQLKMTSASGIILLNAVDAAIVTWSKLESALRGAFIAPGDSLRVYGRYQAIHSYLLEFGGTANMMDIANPLASRQQRGPEAAPNRIVETSGATNASS